MEANFEKTIEDVISDQESGDVENGQDFFLENYKDTMDSEDSIDSDEMKKNDNNDWNDKSEDFVGEEEIRGPILPGGHRFDKKFTCIRYPGKVLHPDNAIQTLGGLASISTAFDSSRRRLGLRFRSSDGYCKASCGDKHPVTGFLLRIRVKKSRIHHLEESFRQAEAEHRINVIPTMPKCQKDELSVINSFVGVPRTDFIQNLTTEVLYGKVQAKTDSKDYLASSRNLLPDLEANNLEIVKKNVPPTFLPGKYEDLSQVKDYKLPKLKVLGRIATEFRFTGLCDFQYLPITRSLTDPVKNECIYESIYPTGVPSLKWLNSKVPYFLPPAAFSRMDSVQHISLKTESRENTLNKTTGVTRKSHGGTLNFFSFGRPDVPTTAPKGIEASMQRKFLNDSQLNLLRAIFDERPIWSKQAILCTTNFTDDQLRTLLPAVAYYCENGPWRIMWVRLGYDPRNDPSSRMYQTLDYRLQAMNGLEQHVKRKRTHSNHITPYKYSNMSKTKTAILMNLGEVDVVKKNKKDTDGAYIYRNGIIPPSRQKFYQYCDVHTEEIQEMLAKLPVPQSGTKCDRKLGWLPSGFGVQCREIINKQVRAVIRKQMNIPDNYSMSLPRERRLINIQIGQKKRRPKNKTHPFGKNLFYTQKKKSQSRIEDSDPDWEDSP